MRKLLIGLLVFGSMSSFACNVSLGLKQIKDIVSLVEKRSGEKFEEDMKDEFFSFAELQLNSIRSSIIDGKETAKTIPAVLNGDAQAEQFAQQWAMKVTSEGLSSIGIAASKLTVYPEAHNLMVGIPYNLNEEACSFEEYKKI